MEPDRVEVVPVRRLWIATLVVVLVVVGVWKFIDWRMRPPPPPFPVTAEPPK
jgi:hypothetical protein